MFRSFVGPVWPFLPGGRFATPGWWVCLSPSHPQRGTRLNRYRCTIFYANFNTEDHVAAVLACSVRGRNAREAAARTYVRMVGRARAQKLLELNAPVVLIRSVILTETCWRVVARAIGRARLWFGRCFVMEDPFGAYYEDPFGAYYIRVERQSAVPRSASRQRTRLRGLLRASRRPSTN
jgi:hypothetical protein